VGVGVAFLCSIACFIDWILRLVPHPNGRESKTYSTYVRAELFHTRKDQEWRSKTVKAKDVLGIGADVMWNETFGWEIVDDPFAFIRYCQYLESLLSLCANSSHIRTGSL
jgi:hypothetical protein